MKIFRAPEWSFTAKTRRGGRRLRREIPLLFSGQALIRIIRTRGHLNHRMNVNRAEVPPPRGRGSQPRVTLRRGGELPWVSNRANNSITPTGLWQNIVSCFRGIQIEGPRRRQRASATNASL